MGPAAFSPPGSAPSSDRSSEPGCTPGGPDLLADDNDDWFIPWADGLKDLPNGKVERPAVKGPVEVVLQEAPKLWVEGGEGVVVVLSALVVEAVEQ